MSGSFNAIYHRLPVRMQDLAITAYGIKLHHRRYGAEHRRWLDRLLESQWHNPEQIARSQLDAIRETIDYAFENVPFYRETYAAAGYHKGDICTLDDLRKLPIVSKEDVRRDPLAFVSASIPRRRLVSGLTSGSTGTPLTLYGDRNAFQRNWAFLSRVRDWFKIPPRSSRVTLWGRHILPFEHSHPPFWRHDYYTRNHLFSVYHLSPENNRYYVQRMAELQPLEIMAYPSAATEIAKTILDLDETLIRPRAVITSGETLHPENRAIIERAFDCKVRDQYGMGEYVAWISQCEESTYHIHPEYGYVETLRDGKIVRDEPGEIIATGFINRAMPLIRYRTGDSAILDSTIGCSCGRAFPRVRELLGRTDDVLYTPDGRPIGRLSPVFKGLANVREGQIVQDRTDHLTLRLVTDGPVEDDKQILRGRIEEAFGRAMKVDFEVMDEIPRTPAGKFRYQLNVVGRTDVVGAN